MITSSNIEYIYIIFNYHSNLIKCLSLDSPPLFVQLPAHSYNRGQIVQWLNNPISKHLMYSPAKVSPQWSLVRTHTTRRRVRLISVGGGTGIGLMQTLALVQNGAKVYITSRNAEKLNDVAKKYETSGEIIPVVGDITTKDGIAKIVKEIQDKSPKGINVLYVPVSGYTA